MASVLKIYELFNSSFLKDEVIKRDGRQPVCEMFGQDVYAYVCLHPSFGRRYCAFIASKSVVKLRMIN